MIKDNLIYTSRFCILSKVFFKIFKNKENFLRLQKPQMEIPINAIKECNYIQINNPKANKTAHFYLGFISGLSESRMEESIIFNRLIINYFNVF